MKKILNFFVCIVLTMSMLTGCAASKDIEDKLKELNILPSNYNSSQDSSESSSGSLADSGSLDSDTSGTDDLTKGQSSDASDSSSTESSSNKSSGDSGSKSSKSSSAESSSSKSSGKTVLDSEGLPTEEMISDREAIGLDDAGLTAAKKSCSGLYCYEKLSDDEKTLYAEIFIILQNHAENIYVSSKDTDQIDKVNSCVLNDHPEIFYVNGYSRTKYAGSDGNVKGITFSGTYTVSADEVASRQTQIDSYVNKCLSGISSSADDYTKIKYVYDYLIKNTDYNLSAADNQNICSVFINGSSVCQGYSKATQYLLNKLGVQTILVTGTVKLSSGNTAHAWNMVKADGKWYNVDTTWGDGSFLNASGDSIAKQIINYNFLCDTTADISTTHSISNVVSVPECTSMDDNYYVKDGSYFTSYDTALLQSLFDRKYAEGADNVTFKCASNDVYTQMKEDLLTNSKMFDYLQSGTSKVSYYSSDDLHTITIFL